MAVQLSFCSLETCGGWLSSAGAWLGANVKTVVEFLCFALLQVLLEEETEPAVIAPGKFLHRLVGRIELRGAVPVFADGKLQAIPFPFLAENLAVAGLLTFRLPQVAGELRPFRGHLGMGAEMATGMLQIPAQSQVTGSGQLGMEIHLCAARIILGDRRVCGFQQSKQVITLYPPVPVRHSISATMVTPAGSVALALLIFLNAHDLALVDVPQVKRAAA